MIDGARIIVTGAAGGIGAALAAELITRGASVVLADLSASVTETAQRLASDHPAASDGDGPRAHAWIGDAASDRKSTRLNSSHVATSYAVFCLKKKKIFAITYSSLSIMT